MARQKRNLSGRFIKSECASSLRLLARWIEDPTRWIQVTVFEQDIPELEAAIATFKAGGETKEVAVPKESLNTPVDADGRKKFRTIGDMNDEDISNVRRVVRPGRSRR